MMAFQKNKWRFVWVLPITLLTLTAIVEILGLDFKVVEMNHHGMAHMIVPLGLLKLVCVLAFLVPKTRRIGFLLCTAYIGGIIAAQWLSKDVAIPGIILQVLLWIGMYFEVPEIFRQRVFNFPIDE